MKTLITSALILSISALGLTAEQNESGNVETYKIDTVHSSVKFSIRHFVAKTTGSFGEFEGTIIVNKDDMTKSSVEAAIKIPTVDTNNEKRDAHLQEDDYFSAAKHPLMTFKSTKWMKTEMDGTFNVLGNLTMNGMTKPVTLEVELLGFGDGMRGAYLSGWEATTTLNRTDWGINGGQPAVGEDVDVTINIEAIRQ
jgi:polyisoprenoid-binding protein YceI